MSQIVTTELTLPHLAFNLDVEGSPDWIDPAHVTADDGMYARVELG
jgi:hypothetical protein